MVKLPDIMYRAPSRLAAPDPQEVLRTGYAYADLSQSISKTAHTWAVAEDTEQTYKNINEQKTILATTESEIKNTTHWDVADLESKNISYPKNKVEIQPTYDPMGNRIGEREVIPTEYVASDLYARAAGEAEKVANTTGVFRDNSRMANAQIGNAISQGSQSIQTWSFNKRYEALNTSAVENYERALERGDLIGALGVVQKGAEGGWLDQKQIAKMTSEAPGKAAVAISDAGINATNDPDLLEDLAYDIENGVGMYGAMSEVKKRTQARAARSKAQAEYTGQDRSRMIAQQRADSEIMLRLYRGEVSVDEAMVESVNRGTPTGMKQVVGFANTQNEYGPATSDQTALGDMNARIATLTVSHDVEDKANSMIIEILTEMSKGTESMYSPKHAQQLINRINEQKFGYASRPDFKATQNAISVQILSMPMGTYALYPEKVKGVDKRIYVDAQNDLAEYMKSAGARAKPSQWWEDNQLNYTRENWTVQKYKDNGIVPVIQDGKVDYEQTRQKYLDEGAASKLITIERLYNQTREE